MDLTKPILNKQYFTIGRAGEVIPILDLGVIKFVGELYSSTCDFDYLFERDSDILLAIIVVCTDDDIIQYISDCRMIVSCAFDSDLGCNFTKCCINLGGPP